MVERSACEVALGVDWTDGDGLIDELDDPDKDEDEDDETTEELLLVLLEDDDNELLKWVVDEKLEASFSVVVFEVSFAITIDVNFYEYNQKKTKILIFMF